MICVADIEFICVPRRVYVYIQASECTAAFQIAISSGATMIIQSRLFVMGAKIFLKNTNDTKT
jgi:hypothetical protein